MSDKPEPKKPSKLMIWAAKKFAGLDDKQGAVLPSDRWFLENFRAAVAKVPGGDASLDKVSSGAILTGAILSGGALAAPIVGFGLASLALGGLALAAAGLTGAVTVQNIRQFRHDILPEAGKDMGRRFLKYQGEIIKEGWNKNREAAKTKKADEPQGDIAPKGKLKGVFAMIEKAKAQRKAPPSPDNSKGPKP